jgi:hypothetical protein
MTTKNQSHRFSGNRTIAEYAGETWGAKRISLKHTRAIIDAHPSGALGQARTQRDATFGFNVVTVTNSRERHTTTLLRFVVNPFS